MTPPNIIAIPNKTDKSTRISPRFWALLGLWAALTLGLASIPVIAFIPEISHLSDFLIGPLTFGFVLVGWVVGVCLHEYAHAVSAYREGDYMAKIHGYLTLDPVKYISLKLSFIVPLIVLIFGGIPLPGAAVNIGVDSLKHGKSQMRIALAGPFTTLAFCVALLAAYAVLRTVFPLSFPLYEAVGLLAFFKIIATFINLLPIPGLDGYLAIEPLLTGKWHHHIHKLSQRPNLVILVYVIVILLAIIVFGPLSYILMTSAGVDEAHLDNALSYFRFWAS